MNTHQIYPILIVLSGAVLMLPSLCVMLRLTAKMPFENLKFGWRMLNLLAIFFVFGFCVTAYAIYQENLVFLGWLISITFFFGAVYVLSMSGVISKTIGELQRSEHRNKLMIEEVQDYAILMLDVDGNILTWNRGAEKIKGYTAEEIIGKSFLNFYPQEDIAKDKPQHLLQIATEQGRAQDEGFRVRKDGTRFWCTVVITAIHDSQGELLGFSKVTRDFTERKQAEDEIRYLNESLERTVLERTAELREANQELNTFAYTIAHDLRSPLQTLSGFSSLVLENSSGKLDEEDRENLLYIQKSAKRMNNLIGALLDFSKLGKQALDKKWVDMGLLINETRQSIDTGAAVIRTREIPNAYCDPVLIGVVWQNLLGNAIKYSLSNQLPEIEIGSLTQEGRCVYYIRDNGVGFDMSHADKLFEVFQRLHTDDEFEGTGIGLATVHKIITKHGGEIWAESKKNEGACFYFSLAA